MNLQTFKCKGCYYFRRGKCLCYIRREGPRGNRDCRSCRCVIISYIFAQKKHTQKLFYHLRMLNKGKHSCGCQLKCKFRSDGLACQRIGPKGKSAFVFHKKCASAYKKCKQMRKLEENLHKFTKLVRKNRGKLEIPAKCVPFLGTKQRNFSEFSEQCLIQCLEKREATAIKTKLQLLWTKPKMDSLDFVANVSSSSDSENSEHAISESTASAEVNSFNDNDSVHLFADISETSRIPTPELVESLEEYISSPQNDESSPRVQSPVSSIQAMEDLEHQQDDRPDQKNFFYMSQLLEGYSKHTENMEVSKQTYF